MLLDRACPRGGWNAGNSEVDGVELDPHPDFTAMAVLALQDAIDLGHPVLRKSLDYLASRLRRVRSPYSLAWGMIALNAFRYESAHLVRISLEASVADRMDALPARTLALAALALEEPSYAFRGDAK